MADQDILQWEDEAGEVEEEWVDPLPVLDCLEKMSIFELEKEHPNQWNQDDLARMLREMETNRVSKLGLQVQGKISISFQPQEDLLQSLLYHNFKWNECWRRSLMDLEQKPPEPLRYCLLVL